MLLLIRHYRCGPLLSAIAILLTIAANPVSANVFPGDLDGDGGITSSDEQLMSVALAPGAAYEPAADLNGDGSVDILDLALFGAIFGQVGGTPDGTPPGLFITLNDIPDDMNDLLVVPPDLFEITLSFDTGGHSAIDTTSLNVTCSDDIGPYPAGSELAPLFSVSPTGAVMQVPAGSNLARTSHYLTASIRDLAANEATGSYGFAVRDFQGVGAAPLDQLQVIHLDFDQDRTLGSEIDFIEDLRTYGLTSAAAPAFEADIRDIVVSEVVARVQAYYTKDGGSDAANILFVADPPAGTHSRICIGGESSLGGSNLGAASLDVYNISKATDECALGPQFGIFPQAIDNLWASDPDFQAAFSNVDPTFGGIAFGEHPLDATVGAPGFNIFTASAAELERFVQVLFAVDAFAQAVATATAHEVGHMIGLTAPGAAPAGLWGVTNGVTATHNATVAGGSPTGNYLMNWGGSFTFGEMTGRGGFPLAEFRPLNWAYLRGRIALNSDVTGLFPAPILDSVSPSVVTFQPGTQNVSVTFYGADFSAPLSIDLITAGDPTPNDVFDVVVVDSGTATGILNKFVVQKATYDVHLTNGDGQDTTLIDGLVVQ